MEVIPDVQSHRSSIVPFCMSWKVVIASITTTIARIPPNSLLYGSIPSGCPGVTCAPVRFSIVLSPCCMTNPAVPKQSL